MPTEDPTASMPPESNASGAPERIGPYTILEPLGEGGFGIVYIAQQTEPVRRRVAIKVIKPGMDSKAVIARFEAERQALAVMDHPCIARVLDAGTTDRGLPYFVMELVKGDPINEFCDTNRVTVEQRVELMIRVCEAVQHAHTKGVIHRDVKPSNVLVGYDGQGRAQPKVIDFGIAKALTMRLSDATIYTQRGQLIGTPEYMSPEQAEMGGQDIDTRADVYSLGVVLYQLLTGMLPFESGELRDAGFSEVQRIIREKEPPRPSTRLSTLLTRDAEMGTRIAEARRLDTGALRRLISRDLDWVAMRCLEKDRERRYDTANALAMELQRYLDDEPVLAGPPSSRYKLGKFVKRNRVGVIAAGAGLTLLVAGLAGTTLGLVQAERQRRLAQDARSEAEAAEAQAQSRADELEQVAEFQAEQLGAIDPELMGTRLRAALLEAADDGHRDLLEGALAGVNFTSLALGSLEENIFERTIEAIDEQFAEQPLVQARLLQTVAETLRDLGLLEMATDPQARSLAIRRRVLGDDHPHTLNSVNNMGFVLQVQGKLAEAKPYFLEALNGRRRVLGDDHPHTLNSVSKLGGLLSAQGMLAETEPYYHEALESQRRVLGDDHPDTLNSVNNMGSLLLSQGKLAEAEPYYREALEGRRRVLGDDHPYTLNSVNNMGFVLQVQGKLAEAKPYYLEALDGRRRVLGDDHPDTLRSVNNMGSLLSEQGKLAEAELYFLEALDGRRRVLGDDHPDTLISVGNMGSLLHSQGKLAETEPYYREALDGCRHVLGDDHPDTLNNVNNMGFVLKDQGKLAEAEPYFLEALDGRRRVLGDDHPDTLISVANLALLLADSGAGAEALKLADEAVERGRTVLDAEHWLVGNFLGKRGRALEELGRFAEAERAMLEAHAILAAALGEEHEQTTRVVGYLIDLYTAWYEAEPGKGHDAKAAEWRAKLDEAKADEE